MITLYNKQKFFIVQKSREDTVQTPRPIVQKSLETEDEILTNSKEVK